MKHWYPLRWKDVQRTASRVKEGDVIHNPVSMAETWLEVDRAYSIAYELEQALAERGLCVDYPHCVIYFVEKLPEVE